MILFGVLAVYPLTNLFSQSQVTFRQLSVKEGLSQNSAISITQDSTGYLWIATQDGLNKYDGRQFSKFPFTFIDVTKADYSHLGKVYFDRRGGLWIIPIDKIPRRFNSDTGVFERLSGVDDVSVLYQDNDLNLWIGTYSNGLFCLKKDAETPKQIISPPEIGGAIFNISQATSGKIILAAQGRIIAVDPKTEKSVPILAKDLYNNPITTNFSNILYDATGRQWIGTFGDGLYFRDNEKLVFQRISQLPFTDHLPLDLNILDLHLDSKERLWVATYGNGLYMINLKQHAITHFQAEKHNPRALHYNDILCIYEDSSGTLWFGTDGAGISYYDEYLEKFNSLTNYQTPENISIDVVRAITVDHGNAVWVGTSGKGLTQYEPASNSWRTFTVENGNGKTITSNRVMSLLSDDENDLWIGTQGGGLTIYDQENGFAHYNKTSKIPLSAGTVWNIFKDGENNIWLGTREHGLVQFDKKKGEIKKYSVKVDGANSPPSNNIRVLTEDDKGNLWIGTEENGIAKFNRTERKFTAYKKVEGKNSLSHDNIKSLYYDEKGILWIGTNGGGLNAFDIDGQKFYSYTEEDGLANNVIYGILPDDEGNLWLSSNKGISKFVLGNNLEDTPHITNYNNYAGLATEFNTGAYHKDSEGNLYFGGLEGFYWFKPGEIQENKFLPKTAITEFMVSNEPHPMSGDVRLAHDQNTLSFSFSSLQYSLPEKNRYQYRLKDYDDGWINAGNNNFARYSFLPPGEYEFQVKSSNYDGVWNPQPANFAFAIAPPWYLTPLAKIIYAFLFLITIFGVYSYLKWRWRMKLNLQLKEEEAQRLKRLNDFKSKLYTDISHEFRTPLTLISGPIDAKLGGGRLSDSDFANFSMIKRNTKRLMILVDQLLHMAKLEKGKLKLKVGQGNLGLFLGALASSFEYQAELHNMEYRYHVNGLGEAWYDEDVLEKIVTNLLSNAFKHSPENGFCEFGATDLGDGRLQIRIKNSVVDFSEVQLDRLFNRFYQKDEYADGAGVGLSLVKELVALYKGEVSAQMEDKNTILFMVNLPMKRELFDDDKITNQGVEERKPITSVISDTIDIQMETDLEMGSNELPIILIVEDHKEVREFLASVWKNKYQIFQAKNGKEGISKALQIVPDLIVTDVRMPLCSGIELCNNLKTDERTSHIPIILLTAGMGEEDELKGLQSGADDFITKPFKLPILEKRVENLIETRKALRSRYSQEVVLQAKDIALTPTDEIFLNRMQKVLDEHLSNADFNAATFCKEVGMSRMQLHRKLLAFTGLSTTAFIRSQRLKQAAYILETSDATVNEVAYTIGFNTPSYFIKCFKEAYGKTPSEYFQSRQS